MDDILLKALKEGRGIYVVSGKDLLRFHTQVMLDAKSETESLFIDRMLNANEAAKLLTTTPRTLQRWDNEGYLKSIRIGGVNKWRYRDIMRLINGKDECSNT
ncbi:MerR family transcriptional regulator [Alistipes putredinis]|uniref:MerR family transcriptional regulator n=1 Tax=Alistipes putredinis TaxID=28117 RepID=UPI002AC34029|nr:helix-turn-helix domain-containing protein [Alistipes putredinis]